MIEFMKKTLLIGLASILCVAAVIIYNKNDSLRPMRIVQYRDGTYAIERHYGAKGWVSFQGFSERFKTLEEATERFNCYRSLMDGEKKVIPDPSFGVLMTNQLHRFDTEHTQDTSWRPNSILRSNLECRRTNWTAVGDAHTQIGIGSNSFAVVWKPKSKTPDADLLKQVKEQMLHWGELKTNSLHGLVDDEVWESSRTNLLIWTTNTPDYTIQFNSAPRDILFALNNLTQVQCRKDCITAFDYTPTNVVLETKHFDRVVESNGVHLIYFK